MDDNQLRLDGNATAGMLREVFVSDLTTARAACASCGAVTKIGSQHAYIHHLSPRAMLRCNTCQEVLMVFVHGGERFWLGLRGLIWLEVPDSLEDLFLDRSS
jgi:hypothetical protein